MGALTSSGLQSVFLRSVRLQRISKSKYESSSGVYGRVTVPVAMDPYGEMSHSMPLLLRKLAIAL